MIKVPEEEHHEGDFNQILLILANSIIKGVWIWVLLCQL
jgi:hypothetical protein